jgi:hypothetical protein
MILVISAPRLISCRRAASSKASPPHRFDLLRQPVRIISLYYIFRYRPRVRLRAHLYSGRSSSLNGVAIFLSWIERFDNPPLQPTGSPVRFIRRLCCAWHLAFHAGLRGHAVAGRLIPRCCRCSRRSWNGSRPCRCNAWTCAGRPPSHLRPPFEHTDGGAASKPI